MIREIFSKLLKLFKKDAPIQIDYSNAEKRMEAMRENFLNSIRYVPQTAIIGVAKRVINKQTKIENLSDGQLDGMLAYYKNKLNVNS